jgi:outer membrane protein OmpA-like peptidoglycan-associated protein
MKLEGKTVRLMALACALACVPFFASAQEAGGDGGLDLGHMLCRHQGPTATGESGLFNVRSGYTLCKGQWAFGTYYNLRSYRLTGIVNRDPLWNDWDVDHEQLSVGFGYGLTDKIEIAFSIPYHWYDAANGFGGIDPSTGNELLQGGILNGRTFFGDIDQSGIGDLRIAAKFQLSEGPSYGMALNAFVDLPTGDDDEAVVTGETGFGLGIAWSTGDWAINAGFSNPGQPEAGRESPQIDFGVGYGRSINERLEWITELIAAIKTDGGESHDEADLTSGVRYHFGDGGNWAFNAGLRLTAAEDVGGLIGLTYSPKRSYELTLSTAGDCSGRVESKPVGANCGGPGHAYGCDETVDLVAIPDDCCEFEGWSGDCSGNGAETSVTLDGHRSCTASFKKKVYNLSVERTTLGSCGASGTVTSDPAGIDCGENCESEFYCGDTVNLTAEPKKGATVFSNWTGDCSGTGTGSSVTMDGDKSCVARFKCDDCYEDQEVEVARAACYFEVGKAKVDNRCKQQLDEVALAMKDHADFSGTVVGHTGCSKRASEGYLQKLSEKRAMAVQEYMVERHGIDASRLETSAAACTEVEGSGDAEARRADISFTVMKRVKVPCQ